MCVGEVGVEAFSREGLCGGVSHAASGAGDRLGLILLLVGGGFHEGVWFGEGESGEAEEVSRVESRDVRCSGEDREAEEGDRVFDLDVTGQVGEACDLCGGDCAFGFDFDIVISGFAVLKSGDETVADLLASDLLFSEAA